VLPRDLPAATRFDQVLKNEYVKRALEVAITGGLSIAIIGVGASYPEALALTQVAHHHGLVAYCLLPCLCGNFGDAVRSCTCSPVQIARMRSQKAYQRALQAVIHAETSTPVEARRSATYRGEPDERILERIAEAQRRPHPAPTQRDAAADRLMTAAIRQLDLNSVEIAQVWQVSAVIAELAGRDQIGAAHLAEAIQYRRRQPFVTKPVV
jgi:predicted ATPase with chaperone activity